MAIWFHSAVLATTLAATAAIGLSGATLYVDTKEVSKADRLPFGASCDVAAAGNVICPAPVNVAQYATIEDRSAGVSTLTRVPLPQ